MPSAQDAERQNVAMGGQGDGHGRVLLTGSHGLIGRATAERLERDGWEVRGFDLADGDDLRDEAAVRDATAGCRAVVHAGAVAHDHNGTPSDIVATNVLGTWHVLMAAEAHGVERVVAFSSVQVFGFCEGEGEPAYLPVDDDHPRRASRPYGMSKKLAEDMCESWTARTAIPTIMLRPVETVSGARFASLDPEPMEMGAYVHVDDVAAAVAGALVAPITGHRRAIVCTDGAYDTRCARELLGWEPARRAPRRRLQRLARRVRR